MVDQKKKKKKKKEEIPGELEIAAPANAQRGQSHVVDRNMRRIAVCAGNQPDCFHLSSGTVVSELMSGIMTVF